MTYANVLFTAHVVAYVRLKSYITLLRLPDLAVVYAGASAIAFAIRSGVNLVLLLARIKNLPRSGRTPVFP